MGEHNNAFDNRKFSLSEGIVQQLVVAHSLTQSEMTGQRQRSIHCLRQNAQNWVQLLKLIDDEYFIINADRHYSIQYTHSLAAPSRMHTHTGARAQHTGTHGSVSIEMHASIFHPSALFYNRFYLLFVWMCFFSALHFIIGSRVHGLCVDKYRSVSGLSWTVVRSTHAIKYAWEIYCVSKPENCVQPVSGTNYVLLSNSFYFIFLSLSISLCLSHMFVFIFPMTNWCAISEGFWFVCSSHRTQIVSIFNINS